MPLASYVRRLKEMPWRDRSLLAEAVATLAVASVAIRVLPFRKVVSKVERSAEEQARAPALARAEIERAAWAIEACARVLPWRIVCFQKGLAMHQMLQRRGFRTKLHYGVAQTSERGLAAHVWITYQDVPIIGGEEAPNFNCLATFPAIAPGEKNEGSGREKPT